MRLTGVTRLLGVRHPILQAGIPWVSNPELVAAVSNAGGMGILHPSSGMTLGGDPVENLRENIRHIRRLTGNSFGVCFYLGYPNVRELMEVAAQERVKVAVTYGGSPALHIETLKSEDITVLHQVGTVRHARGAESQGVDMVIAQGSEGGGIMNADELSTLALVPQVADAVSVPVIASGGIADSRGFAAALALGAQGVQLGTRFVATNECMAHPLFKEALIGAIDTGTIIARAPDRPTRILRTERGLKLRDEFPWDAAGVEERWDSELGPDQSRAVMLEGNLDGGVAYCGAGAGLLSEILPAEEVVRSLVDGLGRAVSSIR